MISNETDYFSSIQQRYRQFCFVVGTQPEARPLIKWSYHPATELEKIIFETDAGADRQQLYLEQERNLVTALAERLQATNTTDHLNIKNGQLVSDKLPEPLIDTMERGVRFRRLLGTLDPEREEAEVLGFKKITEIMVDTATPVGTRIVSLSPPSPVPESPYTKNFADEWTLIDRHGQRTVFRSRTLIKVIPAEHSDSWYLSHPQVANEPIPENLKTGMAVERFAEIMNSAREEKRKYLAALFTRSPDIKEIATTYDDLIDKVDRLSQKHRVSPTQIPPEIGGFTDGPCGGTGFLGRQSLLENSVAKFGLPDEKNYTSGKCQSCGTEGTIGRCTHKCQPCEKRDHPEIFGD